MLVIITKTGQWSELNTLGPLLPILIQLPSLANHPTSLVFVGPLSDCVLEQVQFEL